MNQQPTRPTPAQNRRRQAARQQNSRRHNRKRRRNYLLHYILGFVLIVAAGITLSLTVFFNMSKVEITGGNTTEQDVLEMTGLELGNNLFRMDLDAAGDKLLEKITNVDAVKVSRKLPDTLLVELQKAKAVAVCYAPGRFDFISEKGRIISQVAELPKEYTGVLFGGVDLSKNKVGDFIADHEDFQLHQTVLEELQVVGLDGITQMVMSDGGEITLSYQNRITIQLGTRVELDYKMQIVKKVIEEHVDVDGTKAEGIIDARIPSVAYFRPMTVAVQIEQGKAPDVTGALTKKDEPKKNEDGKEGDDTSSSEAGDEGDSGNNDEGDGGDDSGDSGGEEE